MRQGSRFSATLPQHPCRIDATRALGRQQARAERDGEHQRRRRSIQRPPRLPPFAAETLQPAHHPRQISGGERAFRAGVGARRDVDLSGDRPG
jgi:hypothetical protein